MDWVTRQLRMVISAVTFANPPRTGQGALLGILVYGLIYSPLLSPILALSVLSRLANLEPWYFMLLGIAVLNIGAYKKYIADEVVFDDHTEQGLALIKKAEKAKVSKAIRDKMYLNLVESHLASKKDMVNALIESTKKEQGSEVKQ